MHSTLDPQGRAAIEIARIADVLFAGGAAIFILVLALTAYALLARPERRAWLARRSTVVAGGIAFPLVVLSGLVVYTLFTTARIGAATEAAPLRIEVVGRQWWWQVRYPAADGRPGFATANELRIPVGRPVALALASADVIHSFWVPSLAGKLDMIPGRTNRLRLAAERAGTYRGQCAEFCGGPHALMAFHVVALPPAEYDAWAARQAAPAAAPAGALAAAGRETFLGRCAACHAVRGTAAAGTLGPDLTHVASRRFIGAGLLPNDPARLAEWIARSQHLKPGNLMPSFDDLAADELRGLAAYLAGLE
jgi:cytochrome c oxidase subunit 2